MTELESNLLIEIRRVKALAKTFPAGSRGRLDCEDEVQRSLDALADADVRRITDRLFHLSQTRQYDAKIDALPAGQRLVIAH